MVEIDTGSSHEFVMFVASDAMLIPSLVSTVRERIQRYTPCSAAWCFELELALSEALWNAVFHGNLEVGSELWRNDRAAFQRLANERQLQPPYSRRCIEVHIRLSPHEVTLVVRDEGKGFSIASVPDPCDPANLAEPCGRGLCLMRSSVDRLIFNGIGNRVTLVKRFAELPQAA